MSKRTLDSSSEQSAKRQKTDGKETKENKENKEKDEENKSRSQSMQFAQTQSQHSFNASPEGLLFSNSPFIDFSDIKEREKYLPDIKLVSSHDKTVLHFHVNKLIDFPFFKDKIHPNAVVKSGPKEIELGFSGRIINYFLNYADRDCDFLECMREEFSGEDSKYVRERHTHAITLAQFAKHIKHEHFYLTCVAYLASCGLINDNIGACVYEYATDEIKRTLLFNAVKGYSIIEGLSREFISGMYDYAIKNNMFYDALQNIIPHFIPSDEQINKFKFNIATTETDASALGLMGHLFKSVQLDKDILKEFIGKYYGGNNPGANKILRKLLVDLVSIH